MGVTGWAGAGKNYCLLCASLGADTGLPINIPFCSFRGQGSFLDFCNKTQKNSGRRGVRTHPPPQGPPGGHPLLGAKKFWRFAPRIEENPASGGEPIGPDSTGRGAQPGPPPPLPPGSKLEKKTSVWGDFHSGRGSTFPPPGLTPNYICVGPRPQMTGKWSLKHGIKHSRGRHRYEEGVRGGGIPPPPSWTSVGPATG